MARAPDKRIEQAKAMENEQGKPAADYLVRSNYTTEELYRTPPLDQCRNCKNWQGFNGCRLYSRVLKEIPVKDGEEVPCQYRESTG